VAYVTHTSRMEAAALRSRPARARTAGDRSDGALVARLRRDDEAAFEAIYESYHRKLLAFCHHMLGSREEAEDVLQHTFIAAYRQLRGRDDIVGLKPWLYTVARNRCLSVLRARRDQVALDDGTAATEGLAAEVDRRDDLRLLVRDVQRLAPDQRAALVLFELGDHSHDEIAAVLGVRREKVKALVFQAREALMGWRAARETPCGEVRAQLATLTGSALRRGTIRRHVEQCAGCTEYEAEVRHQRAALAIVLPVAPAAGLKAAVLGTALGGSGVAAVAGTGAATSAGLAGSGAGGIAAKVLVVAAVVGGGGATGYVAVDEFRADRATPAVRVQRAAPAVRAAPAAAVPPGTTITARSAAPATPTTHSRRATATAKPKAHRSGKGRALGTKAAHGKSAAPGQLKAHGAPAHGKALGRVKVKVGGASAKPHPGRAKLKSPTAKLKAPKAKRASGKLHGTAAPTTAPGSAKAPPGQVRKQPR
jgi:RNA polymerase sigma factor (sigma-70 family)